MCRLAARFDAHRVSIMNVVHRGRSWEQLPLPCVQRLVGGSTGKGGCDGTFDVTGPCCGRHRRRRARAGPPGTTSSTNSAAATATGSPAERAGGRGAITRDGRGATVASRTDSENAAPVGCQHPALSGASLEAETTRGRSNSRSSAQTDGKTASHHRPSGQRVQVDHFGNWRACHLKEVLDLLPAVQQGPRRP